jgi:hypothetical protein
MDIQADPCNAVPNRQPSKEAKMDPKKTAVVLIEYQNDFTSEGGTLHQAVKPVMDKHQYAGKHH